jgi:hypothetical protein
LQLDATGIHIVELAKTAPLGKRACHFSTIMVDINLQRHCRVILNFIQKFRVMVSKIQILQIHWTTMDRSGGNNNC